MTMKNFLNLPAPAKLNLFLHIVGKREDGMHLLQSVFQLVDLCDDIDLIELPDGRIERDGDIDWPVEKDLCVRAARTLQQFCPEKGVRITVRKRIPNGAGMGGGSSDAATVLIGLNKLWNLNIPKLKLAELAVSLGADVPFFIHGTNAFVEGIGEIITPMDTPAFDYEIFLPEAKLSTADVFRTLNLTKPTKRCRMSDFSDCLKTFDIKPWGNNDLESVARLLSADVDKMFLIPLLSGKVRMTGSGAAAFYAVKSDTRKTDWNSLPPSVRHWHVSSLQKHPLADWL